MTGEGLSWTKIARLGLAQTALGSIVVLMTSTMNRVMIVELALPAIAPGLLVAAFHALQIFRPAWGFRSDVGGRRTNWIVGGMAALSLGGTVASAGVALASRSTSIGLSVAALGFLLVGAGAGAAGTNVLALLAARVSPRRRAAAATMVWIMMIFGFALTAPLAGHFLDPFSGSRLVAVTSVVSAIAFLVATFAVQGLEDGASAPIRPEHKGHQAEQTFRAAFLQVWGEASARRFTVFIFVSMLAYSAQELLLEPFAGIAFGLPPGATTKIAGIQNGGALVGMIVVAACASLIGGKHLSNLKLWTVSGCCASAMSLIAIALIGEANMGPSFRIGPPFLIAAVSTLGVSNGVYAAAAIGEMMRLATEGSSTCGGTRMGLWGAAQALALATGGLCGAILVDLARLALGSALPAYSFVFVAEALAFLASARIATRISEPKTPVRERRALGNAVVLNLEEGRHAPG